MTQKQNKPTIPCVYIGRRLWNEKIVQVFIDPKKKEKAFTGIRWVTIGRVYLLYADQCPKSPQEVEGREASDDEVRRYELKETLDLTEDKRRKAAKRFSSEPRYLADFEKLAQLCQKMNGSERARFVEFLIEKLANERINSHIKALTGRLP